MPASTSSTGTLACPEPRRVSAAASTTPPKATRKSARPTEQISVSKIARTHATPDERVSSIAAAIGEPARARILYSLMDHHARSSTELATIAGVSPSTASVHLDRLKQRHLVEVAAQGKHRYYRLASPDVAAALEALSVLAGHHHAQFVPTTPTHLRASRTCYDHLAGALGVQLHDRLTQSLAWLAPNAANHCGRPIAQPPIVVAHHAAQGLSPSEDVSATAYTVTPKGEAALGALGLDIASLRRQRRRFAYACLDWSERRPHLAGSIAAAILHLALTKKWLARDLDSRALRITANGHHELQSRFGLNLT